MILNTKILNPFPTSPSQIIHTDSYCFELKTQLKITTIAPQSIPNRNKTILNSFYDNFEKNDLSTSLYENFIETIIRQSAGRIKHQLMDHLAQKLIIPTTSLSP